MEEVKYIPGDLVMTDGAPIGTKKGVVYQVTASDPNRTLTLKDGTVNKGVVTLDAVTEEDKAYFAETSTWVKHIVPIPLTKEILELNGYKSQGFERNENDDNFFEFFSKRNRLYIRYYSYLAIYPSIKTTELIKVKYLHEFQHLLFGLGLNLELKV